MAAAISYDHAGRVPSRSAGGPALEGFVHDSLDRLTQSRRNGSVPWRLEYAPTGEPAFRKLGTQVTWYVGAVRTVTGTATAGCTGIDTIAIPPASRCTAVAGTVKVAAHVQLAEGLSSATGARYLCTPHGQLDRAEVHLRGRSPVNSTTTWPGTRPRPPVRNF